MNGKIVGASLVLTSLLAGAAVYYLQIYGFYQPVELARAPSALPGELAAPADPAAPATDDTREARVETVELRLVPIAGGQGEPMLAEDFTGIDAASSPLRFRGCFRTPMSLSMLTETYRLYEKPVPLVAPGWFSCFDAESIGSALETGGAVAFLSEQDLGSHPDPATGRIVASGVDRVIAVFPDGRAYAWNQFNGEDGGEPVE